MGLEVRISSPDLLSVRRALKQVDDKGLGKQMSKGFRAATKKLPPEIRAEVPKAMPSGYAPVLSKSLSFRMSVRETRWTARLVYRIVGKGRKDQRDVRSLNRGTLRHPFFGNRQQWYAQKVRSGFVDRPVDRLAPDIAREMNAVIAYVAEQITKG